MSQPSRSGAEAVFSLDSIAQLFQHMEWADAAVWRAVLASPSARHDAALRGYLHHLHTVQQAFLQVWKEEAVTFGSASAFPEIADMRTWAMPYYAEARDFLRTANEAVLARPIAMPWIEEFEQQTGRRFERPTLADTMFQVTSHSTYHRGQVNARLRAVGGEPPLVDYIAWIWFGKPSADWGD